MRLSSCRIDVVSVTVTMPCDGKSTRFLHSKGLLKRCSGKLRGGLLVEPRRNVVGKGRDYLYVRALWSVAFHLVLVQVAGVGFHIEGATQ